MCRSLFLSLLAVIALLPANEAQAQPCQPPWCIEVKTPGVGVGTPNVTVQPPAVNVDVSAQRRAAIDAEWRAYSDWQASLRLDVRASIEAIIRARIRAEAVAAANVTLNPYLNVRPPVSLPYIPSPPTFPRMEIGILALCFGAWTGPDHPRHAGYCPPVRLRFDENWTLAIDPSVLTFRHGKHDFASLGLHPALLYSFAKGALSYAESHAYLRGGVDTWFPVYELARTPDAFLGGHAGVGLMLASSGAFLTTELRALVRRGIGDEAVPAGETRMSDLRAGFESRLGAGFSF